VNDGFAYLQLRQSIVSGPSDVNREFRSAVEGHQHSDVNEASLLFRETWSRPSISPAKLRDQLLSRPRELRRSILQSAVDVLIANYTSSHLQSFFEQLLVELIVFRIGRHDGRASLVAVRQES